MSLEYYLVNRTRQEVIMFLHVPASKKRELAGNPVAAAITTWYLLEYAGDEIAFVSDAEWPFRSGGRAELETYSEVTEKTIRRLIENEILSDEGRMNLPVDDFDALEGREIVNIWLGEAREGE